MKRTSIAKRLAVARNVVDQAWPIYDESPYEGSPAQAEAREDLIRRAVDAAFPDTGIVLSEADAAALSSEASSARRGQVALLRLWREGSSRRDASESRGLANWGAGVAARQAGDWVKLIDRLVASMRRYRIVRGAAAGPTAQRRTAQRFARRCAAELSISAPSVRWIRPVDDGGDLVTLGDIAGCAPVFNRSVIYVRADICNERERLRVVAHEVAHHGGATESDALAYEAEALKRHAPPKPAIDKWVWEPSSR
ncbi:MAG: hypothetical protein ACRD2C_03415 [Acidimicrobiales bacterium]